MVLAGLVDRIRGKKSVDGAIKNECTVMVQLNCNGSGSQEGFVVSLNFMTTDQESRWKCSR